MEVLDTTIANVVLPYIAGGMGVSEDEASWVVTTYLVANAIILTASPFLPKTFGRKTFFLICLGLFTRQLGAVRHGLEPQLAAACSASCKGSAAAAWCRCRSRSWPTPSRPQKRGQAFALFGVAVVVAPVVGPTLGGWLADNFSWHWCFLINGPVGLAAMALIVILLLARRSGRPADRRRASTSSASCWSRPSSARSRSCSTAGSRTTGSARPSSSPSQ